MSLYDEKGFKWLAGLLRMGMLNGSFIQEKEIRQWRQIVILSKKYTESLGDNKRRVHKVFESANIKIDSVVTDLFGVTGRNLIDLLISKDNGITLEDVKRCAKGSLKNKVEELYQTIQGFFVTFAILFSL